MLKRKLGSVAEAAASEYPVVTLLGPRQSGKTTLARAVFPDHEYCNLENPEVRRLASEDPKQFFAMRRGPVILDEIQRVPELLSWIQVQVDEEKTNGRFILTGSHQLRLHEAVAQSLAGRTAILRLLPLSMEELEWAGFPTDKNRLLIRGFLPRVYDQDQNPASAYANYFRTYVERDVRQLMEIRNLNLFEDFIRLLAGRIGQLVNLNALSSDVGVSKLNFLSAITQAVGQSSASGGSTDASAQANNPLAKFTAVNLQNYYVGEFTDLDEDANQFILRAAQPFKIYDTEWLARASLPVNTAPEAGGGHKTGLGDFNIFASYLFDTGNPGLSVGLGPQLTAPTATDNLLGSEKWSAGFAHVLFDATSKVVQYGYLLTWQASFAGESSAPDVNEGAFQPFVFYQLGSGLYARSTGIMVYDFESDDYTIPLGLGLGKVFPTAKIVYNAYVEPQYSVVDRGDSFPQWQIFAGFNLQF